MPVLFLIWSIISGIDPFEKKGWIVTLAKENRKERKKRKPRKMKNETLF